MKVKWMDLVAQKSQLPETGGKCLLTFTAYTYENSQAVQTQRLQSPTAPQAFTT